MTGQMSIWDQTESLEDEMNNINALDQLYRSSRIYHRSKDYMQLLHFVAKFRRYSTYNCLLMHIQRPNAGYVASVSDWKYRFGRYPVRNARPIIILQPFGPVMFLYDIEDTEGDVVPDLALKPFDTKGYLPESVYERTIQNCLLHQIEVRHEPDSLFSAGKAIRVGPQARSVYKDMKLLPSTEYLVLLNSKHSIAGKYSSLAHELGHIFCGHLGVDELAWWAEPSSESLNDFEVEAESVSYLVCQRAGLTTTSDSYLSNYRTPDDIEMPNFSLNSVFQATDYIEQMGKKVWNKPLKKPRKENLKAKSR